MCQVLNDDIYLNDLKNALENVSESYVLYNQKDQRGNNCIKTEERIFAYELYHQFRKIMDDDNKYTNLYMSGEQVKNCNLFQGESLNGMKHIIPDMVLHETIAENSGKQVFYVEIKMSNNQALLKDLYKLTKLKKENKLHFKYYVFIVVGMNKCELCSKIYRRRKITHIDGDIICFCFKDRKVDMFPIKDMKK